jgi:hypothetical protein
MLKLSVIIIIIIIIMFPLNIFYCKQNRIELN